MALTERDYTKQINALLPRGPVWTRRTGGLIDAILYAAACEFARVDAAAHRILTESDPRTSSQLLQQWFDDWGVPSECLAALADPTREQMRQDLLAKITSNAGLTKQFFVDLSAVLGYTVEVETFTPHDVTCTVADRLYDDDWRTVFVMNVAVRDETDLELFDATWTVDQPLAVFGNAVLECVVRALAPAHTTVIFSYGDNENDAELLA